MKQKLLAIVTTIREIVSAIRDILAGMSAAQRRTVYKIAAGIGVAIAAKFGIDAHTATQYFETAVVVFSTILVPILAHTKVAD